MNSSTTVPEHTADEPAVPGQRKDGEPTTRELLVEITVTTDAVRKKTWVSGDISGDGTGDGAPLELVGSTTSPMSGLDSAGLGWLTPFISFLEEPLNQLRGNPGPVESGSGEYDRAGQDVTAAADTYRKSTVKETEDWSGGAGEGYRETGSQYADGLTALGEGSSTVASALTGAGEVVAQVVQIVTGIVAEAVGKIVPIMTEAVAQAAVTFGASIAAAIPQCVQIAVEAGGQIAGKLAALLSSGQNLLKLVDGAIAVMQIAKQVLSAISSQSTSPGQSTDSSRTTDTGQSTDPDQDDETTQSTTTEELA